MHCKTVFIFCLLLIAPYSYAYAQGILVLGDSLSAGYGLKSGNGWVDLLQERLGPTWQIDNASISGATTANPLDYIDQKLAAKPAIVIIALGGNDALRGFQLSTVSANLSELIVKSQAQGAEVLLAGIDVPINYGNRYRQALRAMYEQLAVDHDIQLLPFLLEGFAEQRRYFQADGIHPNAEAQTMILANVWQLLEAMVARASS